MNTKLLTVSVASYNVAACLGKCLDSFLECKRLRDIEVIVVDDGSSDGTAEVAKKYVQAAPGSIRLVEKENGGHGSTINTSIAYAQGKYFKVVDADDWIVPESVDALLDVLSAHNVDVAINPYFEEHMDTGAEELVGLPELLSGYQGPIGSICAFDSLAPHISLRMHALTFRTSILKAMPKIDENCFYVDVEYAIFPIKALETAIVLPQPLYCYLLGTSNQSMNKKNLEKRIDQHSRVVKRLSDYYEKTAAVLSESKRELVLRRIVTMARDNYMIYLRMSDDRQAEGIKQFDRNLAECPSIYSACLVLQEGRKKRLLDRVLPRLRGNGFRGLASARRFIHTWDKLHGR